MKWTELNCQFVCLVHSCRRRWTGISVQFSSFHLSSVVLYFPYTQLNWTDISVQFISVASLHAFIADVGPPKISLEPKYRELQKIKGGTRMKLQATVTGNPRPSVTWQLNDVTLTSSGPVNIRTDDAGLSTIEVDDSSRLTAGKYRVTAENNLGRATADIEVTVTGQSPIGWLAGCICIFILFRCSNYPKNYSKRYG